MTLRPDVLIVGAGPTGLTVAAELARRGVAARIIDRSPTPSTETKALGVQARTLELWDRLGIAEQAISLGLPVRRFNIVSERHRIATFDLGNLPTAYPYILMLPQDQTEALLAERLSELGVAVERRIELVDIDQQHDHVRAELHRSNGSVEHVEAGYLVGCDGPSSTVRDRIGARFEGNALEERFAVADLHVDWNLPYDELFAFLHNGDFITFFPMRDGRHRVAIAYTKRETPSGEVTLEEVQHALDKCGPPGAHITDIQASGRFRINQRAVDREQAGRVFLAGDAAHVNSVVGAQGMNIGIQDAVNLGWKLALVCAGRAPPALLDTYPVERRRAARRTVRGTAFFTRLTLLHNPALTLARRRLLPRILARPRTRTRIAWALSQLDISYAARARAGSPDGRPPVPAAGDRAADAMLHDSQNRPIRLFHALRQDQYSLILTGTAGPAADQRRAIIERVLASYPVVRGYQITRDADRSEHRGGPITTLIDCDGSFHNRYRIEQPGLLLLRPDGYLALRLDEWDAEQLEAYLQQCLLRSSVLPSRRREQR
jgi:2-polyprenyl-6-methoxyphenol hydroxylase-like FAD-dependent oxidoreductase